ncbi:acetylglutamate kinase [Leptospira selangorensis]|uniref:Acetylglutamate kinase n=1 Tax=Leptospira selangorensis TaxID=2484982 RepID=A0A5F2C2D9_9LEPT|nr:acetylglutamate kinase [Leptospira selangorensis]TGM16984.1 acetylglutamate kinase [Leptospira selangorensis]TGM21322.1 acetylglutamate kinase [Leptospira selangorensis]
MNHQEILLKLLEVTENSKDSFQFLKLFRSLEPEKFAVIHASSETLTESAEAFLYNLKLLQKLQLFPVVVLEKDGVSYANLFYRSPASKISLESIKDSLEEGQELPGSRNLPAKWFRNPSQALESVLSSLKEKKIPVFVTDQGGSEIYPYLSNLCKELRTKKLILLTTRSGLHNSEDKKISILDFESTETLQKEDELLFKECKMIFEYTGDPNLQIAITSAPSLLKELFTIKGSGTLLRKKNKIEFHTDFQKIDPERLNGLIEDSFGRGLKQGFWNKEFSGIVLESEYKGCALLQNTPWGTFLSKFAVNEIARGEGVGRDIWDEMLKKAPVLFWRARAENTISKWYAKECSGLQKEGIWIYFWIGLKEKEIPAVCDFLRNLPEDLESKQRIDS